MISVGCNSTAAEKMETPSTVVVWYCFCCFSPALNEFLSAFHVCNVFDLDGPAIRNAIRANRFHNVRAIHTNRLKAAICNSWPPKTRFAIGGSIWEPCNDSRESSDLGRPRTTLGFSPPLDARELLTWRNSPVKKFPS